MSSKINQELVEAYNSIYLQKNTEQNARELSQHLMDIFIEEGLDPNEINKDQLYEFCLNENPVSTVSLLSKMGKAKQLAAPALKYVAQRFRTGANLPAGSNIPGQLAKRAAGATAEVAGKAVRAIPKIPGALKTVVTSKKPAARALTALGTLELGRALPQGPAQAILQKGSELLGWSAKQDPGAAAGETAGRLQRAGQALTTPTTPTQQSTKPEERTIQLPAGYRMVNGKVEKIKEDIGLIKKHLLDEGYASTEKQAEVIAVNMSESWKQSILGDIE